MNMVSLITWNRPTKPNLHRWSSAAALAVTLFASAFAQAAIAQELGGNKPPRDQAHANDDKSPEREELKKRFEERLSEINALKDKGVIGETWEGYLEPLREDLPSKDEKKLIEDENKDRKELYSLIANRVDEDKERKAVPPRIVAERNAKRKFENSKPDHYLKINEGRWVQKRDEDRALKITRLKNDGAVGETSDGYLEAISTKPGEDVRNLVEQENRDRKKMYADIAAHVKDVKAEEVARDAAKDMHEHLPPGQSFKSKDGAWEKRPGREH